MERYGFKTKMYQWYGCLLISFNAIISTKKLLLCISSLYCLNQQFDQLNQVNNEHFVLIYNIKKYVKLAPIVEIKLQLCSCSLQTGFPFLDSFPLSTMSNSQNTSIQHSRPQYLEDALTSLNLVFLIVCYLLPIHNRV